MPTLSLLVMATDLVTIATTAVLSQFLGPSAKQLGEMALERAKQVGTMAAAMLASVGREPAVVEPKLLQPIVEAASLESNASLAQGWAALLANAAHPANTITVQPGFAEVLRQLTVIDVLLLRALYFSESIQPGLPLTGTKKVSRLIDKSGLKFEDMGLSIDNLLRLRLCVIPTTDEMQAIGVHMSTPDSISTTLFGYYFLKAVTPPVS